MDWIARINLFSPLDFVAVGLLFGAWGIIGLLIEQPPSSKPSVSTLMYRYRGEWMTQMVTREPRVFDGMIMGNLRQGTAFLASTTMIATGGAMALLGNIDRFAGIAQDLTLESAPVVVWEIKIIVLLVFLVNSFLKFVWAHRLFGYGLILMGSVPNDTSDPLSTERAQQAAAVINAGARGFNRGLRSVYFALASTVWLLGAVALIGAVIATIAILWRREFASHSRVILMQSFDTQT